MTEWQAYLEENKDKFLTDLVDLLKIPSISTEPKHSQDVRKAAEWVADRLQKAGIHEVRIMETSGHPVVYAERIEAANKPTILFYGHFDVQPVDPLELWDHPPFEPHIENGFIYARAASDMKANVLLPIIACEALLKTSHTLPVNVKFLFEGEEEIGSPSLGEFIDEQKDLLSCDLAISADGGIGGEDHPIINLGARGLAGVQVKVQSANVDIHSGMGGYAPNALHGLASIISSLRDSEGRILVDGFYEDVLPISESDRKIIDQSTADAVESLKPSGIRASFGEPEFSPVERMVARPTLEINGLWGGFQGEGVKTVIPHEAFAKITCRLVGNQDPQKIRELVKDYIKRVAPDYVTVELEDLKGSAFPYRLPADHKSVQALEKVIGESGNKAVGFRYNGGTVPVMGMLQKELGVETVTVGASEGGQRAHAPNEFIRLENFYRLQGIYCEYLTELEKSFAYQ